MRYFSFLVVLTIKLTTFSCLSSDPDPLQHRAQQMATAATTFLGSLSPEQKEKVVYPFAYEQRESWSYFPGMRPGIALSELNPAQLEKQHQLLLASAGAVGKEMAQGVIKLEEILGVLTNNHDYRDSDLYYTTIYGNPNAGTWGWRFEGHHLSYNFTVVDGRFIATAPRFLGANPARVPSGEHAGFRLLHAEEDIARDLVQQLDAEQLQKAVIADQAEREILTRSDSKVEPLKPKGIMYDELYPEQQTTLWKLIDLYLSRMAEEPRQDREAAIRKSNLNQLGFAWAGGINSGEKHYYRVQGESFLIEYTNFQNDGNHIHSVWRDFDGDFGRDLLRALA